MVVLARDLRPYQHRIGPHTIIDITFHKNRRVSVTLWPSELGSPCSNAKPSLFRIFNYDDLVQVELAPELTPTAA